MFAVTNFMRPLFSQHFNITINRNQKLGEVENGGSGTVAAIRLLIDSHPNSKFEIQIMALDMLNTFWITIATYRPIGRH